MPVTRPLEGRLDSLNDRIREQREHSQRVWLELEHERHALAAAPLDDEATLLRAEAAQTKYDSAANELRDLEAQRQRTWRVQPGVRAGSAPLQLNEKHEPGSWLASVLQRHSLTTDDIGSAEDEGRIFFDRLREASALMASGPTVVDLDTTSIKIPTLTDRLAPAPIVDELAEIPEVTVPLDLVEVKPPKIATLTSLSSEAYKDARPVVLAANELELIGSIGAGFDLGAFHGAAGSAQVGLENLAGVLIVDAAGALTNLDSFIKGIAALRKARTRATAIYCHPATWERLALLKKATGSNEPLVSGERSATDAPAENIAGVPVYGLARVTRSLLRSRSPRTFAFFEKDQV